MAGVDGLAARIHAASTAAARAIAALRRSRGLLIEALAEYRVALAGVRDLDTAAVPGVFDEALAEVEATTARVQEALSRIEVYLRHLTGPAGAPVPVVAGAGASGAGESSERIARLRARLPPPVKPASGQKTHGLWFARGRGEAESRHLVSGKTINNVPCAGIAGCDRLLARILPEGTTMTVYGVTEDGTRTVDYYRGEPG
ncbi:hypothetical protein CFP71_00975 [Amycolatopsis thailandensis]|uniref:Uncharacterized protein n=1 Tax=Amycolatopsis thailandensis TaxID=589330 RepID=A0A229SIU3_9PSEU|nr:DddA-like double-stranded DNA deaminase toxin [Amycolatopsis thailandensis]OXM58800.1 hypothetical protein CFP71_00975 [Amycolatopsis thailandensis]